MKQNILDEVIFPLKKNTVQSTPNVWSVKFPLSVNRVSPNLYHYSYGEV